MASCYDSIEITQAKYSELFGNSDTELERDVEVVSDIDFDGLGNENSESENVESDCENVREDEAPLE